VEQVLQGGGQGVVGTSGGGGGGGERGRRMNMVQIMCIHVCKCKIISVPGIRGGGMKRRSGGREFKYDIFDTL
jgi:hypothetical protein